ncbi:MAG: hypothetical protein IPM66_09495 [Acidobacteriota bacterium]|nr:MAG: hypothetical protein IPM66_09495 [Acidobacteriota bacterium]
MANASHGNRFELGDSLAGLGAEAALTLSKDSRDNIFMENPGKIVDHAPKGANVYGKPLP